ncbi:hypothetical protein FZC84_15300 [Rossellomorea vietnamensis]|uniref:Lipoprotein n=1 Tax=Rossellomorea vietnamensis TaxID=218284 RepID=A0A5D4MB79_9BACI|nr:hypothetical protein FZC84_15300 [Rossellomorea vietnamensis]
MKKIYLVIISAAILAISTGCSNSTGENEETSNVLPASETAASGTDNKDTGIPEEENSSQTSASKDETEKGTNDFDVDNYLNEKYAIENTHYKTDIWNNEETGRTEYTVIILPDTKEFGQEINEVFKNGDTVSPSDDERTKAMLDMAPKIMDDLTDDKHHVDSVNWMSYDGEFTVRLMQDFQNSDLSTNAEGESLSHYSSKQIEYARVWLQLGVHQEFDELNVRHIPAGTPMNPNHEKSIGYPEDVIQLAGSRLIDGSVTYSGNGDGTINVYKVPLRWDGNYSDIDESFYEEIVEDTELVYIDTGDDEKIIDLIQLISDNGAY